MDSEVKPAGTVLVIDDEPGIREGCRRVLRPAGYRVEVAASAREGLAQIRAKGYDVVLLDVMLPDGRGVDLLPDIHAQDPDTVAIIITGYATVELAVEAIKAGAYDFISKPFTSDLLLLTVNQGVERRRLSLEAKRLQAVEQEAAALARAKEEAERLSELKSRFTFKVTHELRAPVAGAISLIRPLTQGLAGELTDRQRDILERIDARLDILMALVNDLLSLAATQTVDVTAQLEPVFLGATLRKVVNHLRPDAEAKGITLLLDGQPGDVRVRATEHGLSTVFSNLVENGIKYTPYGGCVRVQVGRQGDHVRVAVVDSGIGIPPEELKRVGEEFYRAKNARESGATGTGLGLAIVKELVGSFHGEVTIDSQAGAGTTVTVTLPVP